MLSRVVRQILQATVYDVAIETPLEAAPRISQKINNNIRFKRKEPKLDSKRLLFNFYIYDYMRVFIC